MQFNRFSNLPERGCENDHVWGKLRPISEPIISFLRATKSKMVSKRIRTLNYLTKDIAIIRCIVYRSHFKKILTRKVSNHFSAHCISID